MYLAPRPEAKFSTSKSNVITEYPYQANGWKCEAQALMDVRAMNDLKAEKSREPSCPEENTNYFS